jgi:uncharacterized protein YggE
VRTLTVTGTGSAAAVPDTALIRLSAVHRARTLAEAMTGAETAREAVVTAAGDLVVSTVNLSVWPHNAQGEIPGFEARHALTIATGDLATANELLSNLAYAVGGRLVVEGVELSVRDPSAAVAEAREAAFADARAKAELLAALAGATLAQVESVAEGGASGPVPGGVAAMAKLDVGLQPGQSAISSSLTITWSLADPVGTAGPGSHRLPDDTSG